MKICIFYTSPKLGDLILQLPAIKAISEKFNTKVSICINAHIGIKNIKREIIGEVAEWLKAHAWKACKGAILSWVRIPFSPPLN